MMSQHSPQNKASIFKQLPAKWVIAIVVAVIAYALVQPALNRKLGWQLPSIAELTNNERKADPVDSKRDTTADPFQEDEVQENTSPEITPTEKTSTATPPPTPAPIERAPTPTVPPQSAEGRGNERPEISKPKVEEEFLQTIGNEVYRSPAGLVYRRGSAEGHRLKHLERHLEDQPTRPGSHGVFNGDLNEFLRKIDDAYTRAKKKDKGTKQYTDEGRTVYEASFSGSIGYLGGQEGKRRKTPKLNRLRVVVDRDAVITAFPF